MSVSSAFYFSSTFWFTELGTCGYLCIMKTSTFCIFVEMILTGARLFFNRPGPEIRIFIVRLFWKQKLLKLHCRTANPKCLALIGFFILIGNFILKVYFHRNFHAYFCDFRLRWHSYIYRTNISPVGSRKPKNDLVLRQLPTDFQPPVQSWALSLFFNFFYNKNNFFCIFYQVNKLLPHQSY